MEIVDWPHGNILGLEGGYGETDDFEFKPINTVVNAFHYRALVTMSRMAQAMGKHGDAGQLAEAGEGEYALNLMTDRSTDRCWPHMVYEVGTTITLEAWDNKYKPNQDWNHAWGAAPANMIPRCLMGIQPLEPGFAKVRIKPQVGSLASGTLDHPTVRGTIHVDFESIPCRSFVLNVTIPANMTALVCVPALGSEKADVMLDGRRVRGVLDGKFICLDGIGSGKHTFERRR